MTVLWTPEGSPEALIKLVHQIETKPGNRGMMILSCNENPVEIHTFNDILTHIKCPVFGGVFPELVYGTSSYRQGFIVVGFSCEVKIGIAHAISDQASDYSDVVQSCASESSGTQFLFVDGTAQRIEEAIEQLFIQCGLNNRYIGGGAGVLGKIGVPCIITNQGVLADAIVSANVMKKSGIGVGHGWIPISPPLKITESHDFAIYSLNWEPSFQVYAEFLEKIEGVILTVDNFAEVSKSYPLGVVRLAEEMIVREFQGADGSSLSFVSKMPPNASVQILKGTVQTLVEGAQRARENAVSAFVSSGGELSNSKTFVVDCISRALYLKDQIDVELDTFQGEGVLFGVLSLGEIANGGNEFLELFNKTAVVAILEA